MDSSEVGRYGTISFMKRLEPNTVVAAFPIDEEEVTFGRDPKCSVRLYYKAVSLLHCKIIFEDRKAFLAVLGVNGLIVDGCKVFPCPSSSSSKPTTIPLSNNSDIEIHNKRFRFAYPPKELRAALLATPPRQSSTHGPYSRKALRMSMIQSAQVFSPRPSKDPRENLRVLQSPLKPFRSPIISTHQREYNNGFDDDDQGGEIVLVDGNHPRVVEEEKDLIIFEDVEIEDKEEEQTPTQPAYNIVHTPGRNIPFSPSTRPPTSPQLVLPIGQPQPQPQTPIRRFPRPSLHRAVLIRSAQRAVMQAEMEKEDEDEEKEVEQFVAADIAVAEKASDEGESSDQDDEEEVHEAEARATQATSTWKTKLDLTKIWPFGSGSSREAEVEDEDEDGKDVMDLDEGPADDPNDQYDGPQDASRQGTTAPVKGGYQAQRLPITPLPAKGRSLEKFMTPQVRRIESNDRGRKSYAGPIFDQADAGEGARRVLVEQSWRVKDIVLPEREAGVIKKEDEEEKISTLAWNGVGRGNGRERLSDEERKAIQERRRSALTTPNTFFGGQAPGMRDLPGSPARAGGSTSPTKAGADTKNRIEKDEDEAMDTGLLLEKMKETVEGMKRRRSVNPRVSVSASRISLGFGMSPKKMISPGDEREEFTLLAPGVKEELVFSMQERAGEVTETRDEVVNIEDHAGDILEEEGHREGNLGEDDPQASDEVENDENTEPPLGRSLDLPKTPTRAPANHIYKTPRMDGTFVEPRAANTPSFTGMRNMFIHGNVRVMGTPVFEGIGAMMRTPEGYHHDEEEQDLDEVEDAVEEMLVKRVKTTAATTRRRTPRALVTESAVGGGSTSGEEGDPVTKGRRGRSNTRQAVSDEGEGSIAVQKPKARLLRGRKAMEVVEDVVEQESLFQAKTTRSRKGKATDSTELSGPTDTLASKTKALKSSSKSSEEVGQATPPGPSKAVVTRRVRQTTNDSDTLTNVEESLSQPDPPHKPARKMRTARSQSRTPEESTSEISTPPTTTTKSTRKTAKCTSQDAEIKTTTEKSGGRGIRVKPIDIDMDDDPLDSIGASDEPYQDINKVPIAKVRRGTRSRTTTIEAIKEEPAPIEPDMHIAVEKGRAKGRKTAAKSSGSATRTSARTKKGVSPAPPFVTGATSEDAFDKENAPDTIEDDEQASEKVIKVKITRSKKGSGRFKEEKVAETDVGDVEPPAIRTRARKLQ